MPHSPLPWRFDGHVLGSDRIVDADGSTVLIGSFDCIQHEDGEFLIRAANSHAHLLAACKAALDIPGLCFPMAQDYEPSQRFDLSESLAQIRAAIAKAEGKETQ